MAASAFGPLSQVFAYSAEHPFPASPKAVGDLFVRRRLAWDGDAAPWRRSIMRTRKGRWVAAARPVAPEIACYGRIARRRKSFGDRHGAAGTLLHEVRSFFDQAYRLKVVKDRLRFEMRARDWGMAQLFASIDADGDGELDHAEVRGALGGAGVPLKDMELEALVDLLDADGSGAVDCSEFFAWIFSRDDAWLGGARRRDADDPLGDARLLRRDALRFDATVRAQLHAFWLLADADGDGDVDKDEYLDFHLHLFAALHPPGVAEVADFDDDDASRAADAETVALAEREWDFDRQGCDGLDHARFNLSLFQLVDSWSQTRDGAVQRRERTRTLPFNLKL